MLSLLRQISLGQLSALRGRALLVIGGVAVGTTLIVAVDLVNRSVLDGFETRMREIAGPADLTVQLGIGEIGFPEELAEAVTDGDEVAAAVPMVRGTLEFLAAGESASGLILHLFGVDLVAEQALARYGTRLVTERREASEALIDIRSIFLSARVAADHALSVGDEIRVSSARGIVALTVRGLLEPQGFARAYGGDVAVMDIAAAQWLLDKEGRVDQIDVLLADDVDPAVAAARISGRLPETLRVSSPEIHLADYASVVSSFQAMLSALSLLCLVTGIYVIYNTTTTAAIQRTPTIAELRLLGASRGMLYRLMLAESFVLGALGSLLGAAVGVPLARLLAGTITGSMGVIFQLRFPFEHLAVDGARLAGLILAGVATAVFASAFAARRMSALDPLAQLRGGVDVVPSAPSSRRLVLWWAGLLAVSIVAFVLEDLYHSIAWGNFGSTLWNASVIVIATPTVAALASPVTRALSRFGGAAGRVAAASVFRAPARTGVTTAAIALILTIATILSSLVLSCRESLRSYFEGVLRADLTVSAVTTEGGWLETPLSRSVATELEAIEGVAAVETARGLSGQVYRNTRIGVLALSDGLFDARRVPDGWHRQGDPFEAQDALVGGRGTLLSESLSDRFDLNLGDVIELDSPRGVVDLDVVGVVPDYLSDRGSVILHRDVLSQWWSDESVNRLLVSVAPSADPAVVRGRILRELGSRYRLKVLELRDLLAYHTGLIDEAFAVMNSVQLLIVIVAIAGILDLLVSRIVERRRELGVWRLIGANRRMLRSSVVFEATTIGVIGVVLGLFTGLVTAWLWVRVHFRELLGYYVDFHFAGGAAAWYALLVLVMSLLAGHLAASGAVRQQLLEAIRDE